MNPAHSRRLILALLCLAAACRGRDAAGAAGGTLIVSAGADAETLFPPLAVGNQGRAVTELIYDKLADIGPALNTIGDVGFVPRLAQRWDWSADSLVVTFHLDPRARWHDGQAVTARDVQYAFAVWTDSAVGAAQRAAFATVDSIATPDSLTARVHFRLRTPEQFYAFVYTLIPLPSHRLAAIADTALHDAPEIRTPVGSGPFRFVSWTPRARIELAANEQYYRGRPKLAGVVFAVAAFSRTQWTADTTLTGIPFDAARAAQLLDSLGWRVGADGVYRERQGRPLAFSLLVPASSRTRQASAVLLQAQFKNIGAKVTLEQADFNAFLDKAHHGAFDALMGGLRTTPSPRGVRDVWGTPTTGRGAQNWGRWSNATFDVHVDSALAATSTTAVRAQFRVAYQAAIDDAPAIWLYEPRMFAGVHRRVNVGTLRPDAWWASLADWSINPDEFLPRDRRAAAKP
ncbi:MAG: ABC transporter substrate-binding protein [Gemmatimonadetes bacterium]|nr:ABC transporter substrate-binding protein [Gemmatimonadota bacterium]